MTLSTTILLPRRIGLPKLWGGTRLRDALAIDAVNVGETWEVFDRGQGESCTIENLGGRSLREVLASDGDAILGRAQLDAQGRFPLLLKFLDAAKRLSLQVHPDESLAEELEEGDGGKHEAWVVVDRTPGAELVVGLNGDASELFDALDRGDDPTPLLRRIQVEPGDVLQIAPGTVHCVGGGVVLYEIQQNSDLTYRLSDWGRVDEHGESRALHLEQGRLAVATCTTHSPDAAPVQIAPGRERIVDAAAFDLERISDAADQEIDLEGVFALVTQLSGRATIETSDARVELGPFETGIVAASAQRFRLCPQRESTTLVARPGR